MLVLIDLQDYYLPNFYAQEEIFESLLENLDQRLSEAKQRGEIVINLICQTDGVTIPQVLEMLKKHGEHRIICKDEFDGSEELDYFLKRNNLQDENIELVGAFRDVCVLDTWRGLKSLGYKVLPVKESLTIPTQDNWRKIERFPDGYIGEEDATRHRLQDRDCRREKGTS
jgi:nicotinamidase-related amidase